MQRLCSEVSRWSVVEDTALVKLMSYLRHNADCELVSSLGPSDRDDIIIRLFTDACWNGDAATTKSTNGMWLELYSPSSERCWAIAWSTSKQTATSSSTCEAETVSLSLGLRKEALPVQLLFEELLGDRLPVECNVDNTQAITAVERGYSKKLRQLQRTQRVAIGVLNECVKDASMRVSVRHCPTALMKADLFTKVLDPSKFATACRMIGIQPKAAIL